MKTNRNKFYGFTLVELLIALCISGIILAAAATLAYAMNSAYDSSDEFNRKQSQVRYAASKLSDLIGYCKLVCAKPGNNLVLWKADNNPANGKIDVTELAYIDIGNCDCVKILEFSSCPNWLNSWFTGLSLPLDQLGQTATKNLFVSNSVTKYTIAIPQCSEAQIKLDVSGSAPLSYAKNVNISFVLMENGVNHQYELNASLKARTGNILNSNGYGIVGDDD